MIKTWVSVFLSVAFVSTSFQLEPFRVSFDVVEQPDNDTIKEYIHRQLIPEVRNFLTEGFSVEPHKTKIRHNSFCVGAIGSSKLRNDGYDSDLVIILAFRTRKSRTIASSSHCQLDSSSGRPLVGSVIFNLNFFAFNSPRDIQMNFVALLHEIFHIMAFSTPLFQRFPNPTSKKARADVILTDFINGRNVSLLNLPKLTARLQRHFGCQKIKGALLEDQGSSGSAGNHFERRIFMDEIMTSSAMEDARISEFTFAVFEDSGWYQVNYLMAEELAWGKGAGCDFIFEPCIASSSRKATSSFFCSDLGKTGCSYNSHAKGICGRPQSLKLTNPNLPAYFNYWGDNSVVVDDFADNCPYYTVEHEGMCALGSGCFELAITKKEINQEAVESNRIWEATCAQFECVQNAELPGLWDLQVFLQGSMISCSDQQAETLGIRCPDAKVFCQAEMTKTTCRFGCSGNGKCIPGLGCSCFDGWGGEACLMRVLTFDCPKCAFDGGICIGNDCTEDPDPSDFIGVLSEPRIWTEPSFSNESGSENLWKKIENGILQVIIFGAALCLMFTLYWFCLRCEKAQNPAVEEQALCQGQELSMIQRQMNVQIHPLDNMDPSSRLKIERIEQGGEIEYVLLS